MTTTNAQTNDTPREATKPDWIAKAPRRGRNAGLARIGAAWTRKDGGICVRLIGTQVVDGDLYLYPNAGPAEGDGGAK